MFSTSCLGKLAALLHVNCPNEHIPEIEHGETEIESGCSLFSISEFFCYPDCFLEPEKAYKT